jgi:hypothetical protein
MPGRGGRSGWLEVFDEVEVCGDAFITPLLYALQRGGAEPHHERGGKMAALNAELLSQDTL